MTDLARWNSLKVGSPITGFVAYKTSCVDNLQIIAVGYDWAVLRNIETGMVIPSILEPDDTFNIGHQQWTVEGHKLIEEAHD